MVFDLAPISPYMLMYDCATFNLAASMSLSLPSDAAMIRIASACASARALMATASASASRMICSRRAAASFSVRVFSPSDTFSTLIFSPSLCSWADFLSPSASRTLLRRSRSAAACLSMASVMNLSGCTSVISYRLISRPQWLAESCTVSRMMALSSLRACKISSSSISPMAARILAIACCLTA